MSFERFIAQKHLTHRRRTGFISLISFISIGGVAVGVMALIVVLAVMSGFDRELKAKIVNVQPHLRIEKMGGIENPAEDIQTIKANGVPGLETVAPFVEGQAIIRSKSDASGVIVKGLDAYHEDLSIYEKKLVAGKFDFDDTTIVKERKPFLFFFHRKPVETQMGSLFIGETLAARLNVHVGDEVQLISPFTEGSSNFSLAMGKAEVRLFVIRGIFRVGMNDFDSTLALINLKQAQGLYHMGSRVTGIGIRFYNVDDAEQWKFRLAGEFGPGYFVRSWYDMNHNFFQALKVEKSVMAILLALIILVATFNIVSTLTMVVMEKTKDIGILRALGTTRASIRKIFVYEGMAIGFFGVVSGTTLGLLLAHNLNAVSDFLKSTTGLEVFPSDIYYFDRIPTQIYPQDVVITVAFAVVASILAGLYPAHRAAALKPIEALHFE